MANRIVIKDKNLKPENIKKGVKILNVTGTLDNGHDSQEWDLSYYSGIEDDR